MLEELLAELIEARMRRCGHEDVHRVADPEAPEIVIFATVLRRCVPNIDDLVEDIEVSW